MLKFEEIPTGQTVIVFKVVRFDYEGTNGTYNRVMIRESVQEFAGVVVGGARKFLGRPTYGNRANYEIAVEFYPSKHVKLYRVRKSYFGKELFVHPEDLQLLEPIL